MDQWISFVTMRPSVWTQRGLNQHFPISITVFNTIAREKRRIRKGQSVKGSYTNQLGWPIQQDDVSTKERGTTEKNTYWEANCTMWFFYPSKDLPQSIDLFVLVITKLECTSSNLWYLTKGTKLIWQTRDENGSQVPCGTRSCDNRMIQHLWLHSKATEWLSEFVFTF